MYADASATAVVRSQVHAGEIALWSRQRPECAAGRSLAANGEQDDLMLFDESKYEPGEPPGSLPLAWLLVALLGSAAMAWLSLPQLPQFSSDVPSQGDVFRADWFVAGTLLVFPVFYASRLSWWMALPSVALPSAQAVYVAMTAALDRLRAAGLATDADLAWYAVAALQLGLFVIAGMTGARRNLGDRRLARLLRAMEALDATPDRRRR